MYFIGMLLGLALAMPAPALAENEGDLLVEVHTFAGVANRQSSNFARYLMNEEGKLQLQVIGSVYNGTFVPRTQILDHIPQTPFKIGLTLPEAVICSDLLIGKELPVLKSYQDRHLINSNQLSNILTADQKLDPNQLTYLEVKQFTTNRSDPKATYIPDQSEQNQNDFLSVINQLPAVQMQGGAFYHQPTRWWRVVGGLRLITNRVDGVRKPLALEINPEPGQREITESDDLHIEISRLLDEGQIGDLPHLDRLQLMKLTAQRVLHEMEATGITDPKRVFIYGHAVTPLHIRYYNHWPEAGMEVFWMNEQKTNAIYRMRGDDFLKNYSAAEFGFSDPDWIKVVRDYADLYQAVVQVNKEPPLRLRFFGNSLKTSVPIPQNIHSFLSQEFLSYIPEDIQVLDHYFMDSLGLDRRYLQGRMANSSILRMGLYLHEHNYIKLDIPYRMPPQRLLSDIVVASRGIEELLKRKGLDPLTELEKERPQMVFFSRDPELNSILYNVPELSKIGIKVTRLGRSGAQSLHQYTIDLLRFYQADRIEKQFSNQVEFNLKVSTPETLIRSLPELE